MNTANFVDHVRICCRSGKGGDGSVHFRREKNVPKGGPDGGDGGRGGHIILKGDKQKWTLLHLRYRKHVIAQNGAAGGGGGKSGAQGKDEILEVPVGTVAKHADTGEVLFEIMEDGEEKILTHGGKGGKGNLHYKSAQNQAPRHAQSGDPGSEEWMVLELKLLADVGLVGYPNAGKSTLLSVLSAAKPEIADYPFTTVTPNLGVVEYREDKSFVIADIPGIIEGASEGKGLGDRFLRHIERNAVLLFTISVESLNVQKEYEDLVEELKRYNMQLLDKKRLIALTKSDLLDEDMKRDLEEELELPVPYLFISSMSNEGMLALKDKLWEALSEEFDTE